MADRFRNEHGETFRRDAGTTWRGVDVYTKYASAPDGWPLHADGLRVRGEMLPPGMLVVGDVATFAHLGECTVQVVRPAGTLDVEQNATGEWFRVSGLASAS